jgi:TP901 family phage tail tape measure protein
MADVNANIGVNIDTSAALAQLKSLQRQISQFHTSISKSSESAAIAQKSLQKNLLNSVNSIGAFSAELRTVKTSAESFTASLEGNKFSMREYFRYAGASTRTFGRLFKSEFDTIGKVAEERVKRLQTQYIKLGRDTNGAMQALAVTPTSLNMNDYGTRTAMAAQKQALFNQLMKQGSTNLLNFGKNTQWAGRQLMVGFTIPLSIVGSAATKTFMDMEAQALKFKKVYGDLFTPQEETQAALDNITELGRGFTKYGIAVSQTVGLASEAAAAGFQGLDLQRQTTEATRLSVLGQIDSQKALETTIALQNAFGMSSEKLAGSIDFLNAVENQTVVSLDDITTAIPKVAPVIQQLGGDVKDLTFFISAMKEGGINASEGANALKSGLAALINPTGRASEMLAQFGINAREIVTSNKGDLKATVIEFATALNQLDPLNRAQAIEQMFGKFQFARLSTLFANVTKEGNQASRVLALANSSVEELSSLSEKELGMTAESSMNKFKKTVEDLKVALIPVGKAFLEAVTPILEFVANALEKFGNLSDGTKKVVTLITLGIAGLGPIFLMTFGLLANLLANAVKGAMILRNGYLRLTGQSQVLGEQTQYLTMEQIEAAAAAHSLDQSHARLTQQFTAEASAVAKLIAVYQQATVAGQKFMLNNPGMMLPGARKGYANGVISVPGSGKGDTVPAMLTPGEAVIPAAMAKKYAPLIQGMIAGNIPGYMSGTVGAAGQMTQLDFARSDTATKAQKLIDELLKSGNGIENASEIIEETLQRVSKDTRISIGGFVRELDIVTQKLSGKQIPGSILSAAGRGQRSFNASQAGVGTMSAQAEGNPVLIEEITRAKESSRVAQEAMIDYYTSIGKDASEFSGVVKQAGDVHRAHVIDIRNNVDKMFMEAWDPDAWIAQSSTLNQVSNILQSSESTRDEYFKQLSEVNADESVIATIRDKITNNLALTEEELVVQKQVLERILASTSSMSKVAAGFGPQAAGAVAATDYLMQNPAKQQGVGSRTQQQRSRAQTNLNTAKFRGQQTFVPVTQAAQDIVDQTVLATARAAGTQSPSKRTIPIGEDIAKGLEVGMGNREDDVAKAGSNLSNAAVSGTQRRVASRPQGAPSIPMSQVTANTRISPQTQRAVIAEAKVRETTTQRMQKLDRSLMGASFAVSSLSGVASMSGGKLGTMAGTVAKVTAAMFALQAITSLLTQTNAVALLQKRIEIARSAGADALAAGKVAGGLSKAVSGRAGLIGIISRVGVRLVAFLGPVGMAIAALGTVYSGFKFFKNKSDQAAFAAEGLAKAMTLSKDKVKILAELLGQTPTPRAGSGARVSANQLTANEQSAVDVLRADETFLKEFKDDIRAMREASDAEVSRAFSSIAIDLAGQGFSKKSIKTYIDALGEEAGKTKVALKFKEIDITKKEGMDAAIKLAKDTAAGFNKAFKSGVKVEGQNVTTGLFTIGDPRREAANRKKENYQLTKEQEKNLNLTSATLANTLAGMTSEFGKQTIKADQYNKSMAMFIKTIPKGEDGLVALNKILANLSPELATASKGVKNYDTKLLLVKAALVNASIAENIFKDLLSDDKDVVKKATERLEQYRLVTDEVASQVVPTLDFQDLGDTGTPAATALSNMQDKIKAIREQAKAYNTLRAAGVNAKTASDMASDSLIAADVAAGKIKAGTGQWAKLVKQLQAAEKQANNVGKALGAATALTDLQQQTKDINAQKEAYIRLTKSGYDAKEAEELVNDVNMANLINSPKLADLSYKKLRVEIDKNAKALGSFDMVKDPFANVKKSIEAFNQEFDKAMEHFRIQEAQISQRFNPLVEKYKKAVDEIQDKINEINKNAEVALKPLNDESAILSNSLSIIDYQSKAINEKYDLQAKELQKISDINSEIANQQKQQLTLADALSQGDISAAAAAAQDMRASAAQNALGRQTGFLDAARKQELDSLLVNGMTRAQIEERQYQISQLTYAIEQKRNTELNAQNIKLEAAQKIYDETQKQFDAALKTITDQKIEWEKQKLIVDALPGTLENVNGILQTQEAAVLAIAAAWAAVAAAQASGGGGGGGGSGGGGNGTPGTTFSDPSEEILQAIEEGKILMTEAEMIRAMNTGFLSSGGLVPKYFANGGLSRGTDTVPAMLTPGEFVMRKSAVDKFGPLLSAINDPSFKMPKSSSYSGASSGVNNVVDNSSAMYNYNIGITVPQSNANPNDIANAVIGQIKYIDAQRIRGQR